MTPLPARAYLDQRREWPAAGRHILAHFDGETIVVYQAYRPAIAAYALQNGRFGGDFSYSRMSWIKPNFLWMMYRSGWGTKEGQETILALRLRRPFFEGLLRTAVPSGFEASGFPDRASWTNAIETSSVRLQWDPDHAPDGAALPRRALQLGLRGATLETFGKRELLEVIDMTAFVSKQRQILAHGFQRLVLPAEQVFQPSDARLTRHLGLDPP